MPRGQFLFVINLRIPYPPPAGCPQTTTGVCPSISVFTMKQGSPSTLTLASGSPFYLSKTPSSISAVDYTPPGSTTAQELLFVANNFDICTPPDCIPPSPHNDSTVSIYGVSSSGVLSEQPNSPYSVAATDPVSVQAVVTNPGSNTGGLFVYVGQGAGVGSVYPFPGVLGTKCTTVRRRT